MRNLGFAESMLTKPKNVSEKKKRTIKVHRIKLCSHVIVGSVCSITPDNTLHTVILNEAIMEKLCMNQR